MYTTPQSRHKRAPSPPLSVAGSSQFTTTPQQKLNVVTRLAIEGKAKHADDGSTIRMYLKLSIPMDSVYPGSTVPLFPEENLKLLSAQVHPLDFHSAPYNFSSTTFPLLNNAARALHLPSPSQKSYLAVFGVPIPASPAMHSSRTSSSSTSPAHNTHPLDEKYTGHIIVSGYNISYILPKEFPPRFNTGDSASRVATQMRRPSISERNSMHFMAAIELWIPYALRPPRAPFLIAIPLPRCLSNNIKLRIYPPPTTSTSSSLASLSSADEDPGAWELASEPHVTRATSRSGSSADMADDESSDSSPYTDAPSGGILVQGSFPSTERLRVRWAQPTKSVANSDGRRRVGVKEAKGEMSTVVLGKAQDPSSGREGILMRLEYKGTCKGIWFPGVATMLGMDIGLEVKGADVVWPPGEDTRWNVTGGTGYTGFDVGPPSTQVSRQPSLDLPTSMSSSGMLYPSPITTRQDSSSSTSSLLRAPLPNDHLPDYSFEGSPTSLTPSVTLSSVSSLPPMSEGRSRASSDAVALCQSPAIPITIHINMNDITPPSKNVFTFSITGTVLIIPRQRPHVPNGLVSDNNLDVNPIVLPRFCVLAADSATVSTIIRNESEGSTVEVYYITGDLRDAQTRKTVLQRNAINRCGNDGARIALRPISRTTASQRGGEQVTDNSRLSPRHSPLNGNRVGLSPLPLAPLGGMMRRKRDGPLMISFVDVVVTPLRLNGTSFSDVHGVRVHMHAPPDADSEWLEFGLAQVTSLSPENVGQQYRVDIVSVCIDGVPVRFECNAFAGQDKKQSMIDLVPSYDKQPRNHWITWVKIHVGDQGGSVRVDYVAHKVGNPNNAKRNVKGKTNFDVLIPTFALPVGRLQVMVETEKATLHSNFAHQQKAPDGYRLLHYSLDQLFTPTLSLTVERYDSRIRAGWSSLGKLFLLLLWILPILVSTRLINLGTEFKYMRQTLDRFAVRDFAHGQIPTPVTETIFITTTVFSPSPSIAMEVDNVNSHLTTPSLSSSVSIFTAVAIDPTPSTLSQSRTSDQSQTETAAFTSIPTPSSSPRPSENSLIPVPALQFEWGNFRIDLPPVARETVDSVLEGLSIVWQMFRKAYHYPLDPP